MTPALPTRRRTHVVVTALLSLAASPLVATGAYAEPLVEVNLLNLNDFHGRIDANTVKVAGTIEALRAEGGEASSLLLAAGDNIGATVFASASQDDQPTLDVLNALDLATSALGNHEFDRGEDHLRSKVIGGADGFHKADFPYLGANVYVKGTTTPAFPDYATFTVAGLDVAVIGAVTEETSTLVSPGGIANLDFGDPVDAVNRVANQIEGDVDVIVAEYHEGATAGDPPSSLLAEIARGGAFAKIVTQTDASVDAIFTGHTHMAYTWDGEAPGCRARPAPSSRPARMARTSARSS